MSGDPIMCICPGIPLPEMDPCTEAATQEDLLCDHCRETRCPTVVLSPDVRAYIEHVYERRAQWRAEHPGEPFA